MTDNFIAELDEEEWKAFKEYDERPSTQEEIEQLEESRLYYAHHECRKGDDAIRRFYKL